MKRTPLKRGGPLKRKARLKVKGKSRFPKRRNKAYRRWIQTLPCILTGCIPGVRVGLAHACDGLPGRYKVECAHIKTRGSGGDDIANCVPLCPSAHLFQEGATKDFERWFGVDLRAIGQMLAHRYLAETGRTA